MASMMPERDLGARPEIAARPDRHPSMPVLR
jgi:hypothetical protein